MARTHAQVIAARTRTALALVAARTDSSTGCAHLSQAELAAALGVTVNQARCVIRHLSFDGLAEITPRYLPNGGQLENSYTLTPAGWSVLGKE